MNKNLMAIFKRDKDETWWCPDCHKLIRKGSKCSCGCEISNQVSLWEVLEKLNEYDLHTTYDKKGERLLFAFEKEENYALLPKHFFWILSDKSGEVPLHRQSKETQDSLWEILK